MGKTPYSKLAAEQRQLAAQSGVSPAPRRNVRNLCAKTRPESDPYEVWQSSDGTWTWKVLKKYQVNDDKPYARWFCAVTSPFTFGNSELGDCYVRDVKTGHRKVA
jgi:hypothetical protein